MGVRGQLATRRCLRGSLGPCGAGQCGCWSFTCRLNVACGGEREPWRQTGLALRPRRSDVLLEAAWVPEGSGTSPLGIRGAGRYTVCAHGKNTFQVSLQTISELLLSLIVHILILSWHQKATRRPAGGFRVGSVPVLTVSKQSKEFGGVWGVSCLRSSSVVFRVQTAQSFAPPSDQQAL